MLDILRSLRSSGQVFVLDVKSYPKRATGSGFALDLKLSHLKVARNEPPAVIEISGINLTSRVREFVDSWCAEQSQ